MNKKFATALKAVGVTLSILGLAGILWTAAIWNQYLHTLPRYPDTRIGSVYPLNIHGIVVYQTVEQQQWRDSVQWSSIAVFATSALLSVIYRLNKKDNEKRKR
jgi:hypothetical protein